VASKKADKTDKPAKVVDKSKSEPFALMWHFEQAYLARYNKKIVLNKYKGRMAMKDVIDTVGYGRAIELIAYYFKIDKFGHPFEYFLYNFDKMDVALVNAEKDKGYRRILIEATKKMVEDGGQ